MARAHFVKAARKDYPEADIKKGESYYWWEFRFGGSFKSKTPPTKAQLTGSDFLKQVYEFEDRLSALSPSDGLESITADIETLAEDIRALGEEQTDKRDNMPEGLQEGTTGELLQNRADELEDMASQLESIDMDVDDELTEEEKLDRLQEIIDEAQGISYSGE